MTHQAATVPLMNSPRTTQTRGSDEAFALPWASLYRRARRRKGWTYDRVALEAGLDRCAVIRACTTGHVYATTAARLAQVLGLTLSLESDTKCHLSHP